MGKQTPKWAIRQRPDCTDWTWEVFKTDENYTVDVPVIGEPTCGCGQPECEHIIAVLRAKYSPLHPILQKQKAKLSEVAPFPDEWPYNEFDLTVPPTTVILTDDTGNPAGWAVIVYAMVTGRYGCRVVERTADGEVERAASGAFDQPWNAMRYASSILIDWKDGFK